MRALLLLAAPFLVAPAGAQSLSSGSLQAPLVGNVSSARSTARGSTVPRKLSDREADVINVMDFGALGNDVQDDAPEINAALAYAKTLMMGSSSAYSQTNGPNAYVLFPSGHRFRINSGLNFTGFDGNTAQVIMTGSSIDCHVKGGICLDALGSNELRWHHVSVVGDPTDMPLIGVQIGRYANGVTADNHEFDELSIQGQYSFAAMYNFAAETTHWTHPEIYNYSGYPGSYAFVEDGFNHAFTVYPNGPNNPPVTHSVSSAFVTVTAKVDNLDSFNENAIETADIRGGIGQTIPLWLGGTNRLEMPGAYIAGGGTTCSPNCYDAVLYGEGGVNNTLLKITGHFEAAPGLTDEIYVDGSPYQTIYGLVFRDNGPEASNSVFKLASTMTGLEARDWDIHVGSYQSSSVVLFNDPTKIHMTGRYSSQSIAGFNPGYFSGVVCTPAGCQQTAYGTASLSAQIPDSTPLGGNNRGTNSVDWQIARSLATQVASGLDSFIPGGQDNAAPGNYASVLGGSGNTASGPYSTAFGVNTIAKGQFSTAMGANSVAAGNASVSLGVDAYDYGAYGTMTFGVFRDSGGSLGQHQMSWSPWKVLSTSTTPVRATADGGAPFVSTDSTGQITSNCRAPQNGSTQLLNVSVILRDSTDGVSAYSWSGRVLFQQGNSPASEVVTASSVAPDVISVGTTTGAAFTVGADKTDGCLAVTWTAPNADTWRGTVEVHALQVVL